MTHITLRASCVTRAQHGVLSSWFVLVFCLIVWFVVIVLLFVCLLLCFVCFCFFIIIDERNISKTFILLNHNEKSLLLRLFVFVCFFFLRLCFSFLLFVVVLFWFVLGLFVLGFFVFFK